MTFLMYLTSIEIALASNHFYPQITFDQTSTCIIIYSNPDKTFVCIIITQFIAQCQVFFFL